MAIKSKWFGFNPPFVTDGRFISYQEDERLIKNDLKQLLLTIPGERVMRPTFGTNLRRFLMEDITKTSLLLLRENILEAIAREEPRISVSKLGIIDKSEQNMIIVEIQGALSIDPANSIVLDIPISFDEVNFEVKE